LPKKRAQKLSRRPHGDKDGGKRGKSLPTCRRFGPRHHTGYESRWDSRSVRGRMHSTMNSERKYPSKDFVGFIERLASPSRRCPPVSEAKSYQVWKSRPKISRHFRARCRSCLTMDMSYSKEMRPYSVSMLTSKGTGRL